MCCHAPWTSCCVDFNNKPATNWLFHICRPDITYFLDGEEAEEAGLPAFTLTKFN